MFVCLTLNWQRIENTEHDGACTSLVSVLLNKYAFNGDFFTACLSSYCFAISIQSKPTQSRVWQLPLEPDNRPYSVISTAWMNTAECVTSGFFLLLAHLQIRLTFWAGSLGWISWRANCHFQRWEKLLPMSPKALQLSPIQLYLYICVYTAIHHHMLNGIPQT